MDESSQLSTDERYLSSVLTHNGSQVPLLGDGHVFKLDYNKNELNVPKPSPPFLVLRPVESDREPSFSMLKSQQHPAANSSVYCGTLEALEKLTSGDAKVVYRASIKLNNPEVLEHKAGDSISILCANHPDDVNWLLSRTCLDPVLNPDCPFSVESSTSKPVSPWLIPGQTVTARFLLTYCCELHCPVSRRTIRLLADCCSDSPDGMEQSKRLMLLCSREGNQLYDSIIRGAGLTLLDLLCCFPECRQIPLVRLLELLPRLQPRPYTLIDEDGGMLQFIFTRVDFHYPVTEEHTGVRRYRNRLHGTCTGWLETLWNCGGEPRNVLLYLRQNLNGFYLPEEPRHPLILIGAGSGLAPFLAFLSRCAKLKKENAPFPAVIWLIYGCRSPETSLILADKLDEAIFDGILKHCCLCFSRYPTLSDQTVSELPDCVPSNLRKKACLHLDVRYVQDCIFSTQRESALTLHDILLAELVVNSNATIMVCGESRAMAPAVYASWENLLSAYFERENDDRSEGREFLKQMRASGRYKEDIWT